MRRTRRAQPRIRVLTAPEPNATLTWSRHLRCHLERMEDLGTSPISEQLSDQPPLAFVVYMDAPDIKHNRDREIKHRAPAAWRTRRRLTAARILGSNWMSATAPIANAFDSILSPLVRKGDILAGSWHAADGRTRHPWTAEEGRLTSSCGRISGCSFVVKFGEARATFGKFAAHLYF